MQKIGDVCENCRQRWEKKGKEPKVLQAAGGTSLTQKMKVPLCPFCDGDAVTIVNLGNHDVD
jgi:hypothetical protein